MRTSQNVLVSVIHSSPLDAFDPRCRVACALLLSSALAAVRTGPALTAGLILPVVLVFVGKFAPLAKTLFRLNGLSVFAWILLPLTVPGERWGIFSQEGLKLAFLTTLKLNLISVVLLRMVASLGIGQLDGVLGDFRVPKKMRVLLLMTLRCVSLLSERIATTTRAMDLRAPRLRGTLLCRAFACMLGTTLVRSSDRAERSMLAMRCRGGTGGFLQSRPTRWRTADAFLCGLFALNVLAMTCASLCF